MAHIRRADLWIHGITSALLLLHWFNPLVWYAARRMKTERETSCNASALSMSKIEDPKIYGRTLLKLMQSTQANPPRPELVGILKSGLQIERRRNMITQSRKSAIRSLTAALILCTLA
ncbi:MAG TPA: hypothetical protein EYG38_02435, partial [Verrucomicrobia bacterium]|nr:hypothetical protein [Verrucomicrobiota bacterium]